MYPSLPLLQDARHDDIHAGCNLDELWDMVSTKVARSAMLSEKGSWCDRSSFVTVRVVVFQVQFTASHAFN
jgi:hypothetical protein